MGDDIFTIEMFPAQQGDALWIEYGPREHPHRILIDGGTPPTAPAIRARIAGLAADDRRFDLIAVTHIDTDHIGGMLKLVSDHPGGLATDDFWFNGWPQLPGNTRAEQLGPIDGEILERLIEHAKFPWNKAFDGGPVVVPDDPKVPLPTFTTKGGMKLTVVSPTTTELGRLKTEWRSVLAEAGLDTDNLDAGLKKAMAAKGVVPKDLLGDETPNIGLDARTPFTPDGAVANSTSIGVLAEYGGRSALLTGDAWAPVLEIGLRRLLAERKLDALPVGILKVGHHGSKNNTSMSLLEVLDCPRFLFSSSGAIFHHPDHQAVSRTIASSKLRGHTPTVYFNYRTKDNEAWASVKFAQDNGFEAVFPDSPDGGLVIDV